MTDFSRFQKAIVDLGTVNLEAVRDPNEDNIFYLTQSSASKAIGFAENWIRRTRTNLNGKTMKALQAMGFNPVPLSGKIERDGTGFVESELIDLDNFILLSLYAISKGKPEAIALQVAFSDHLHFLGEGQ